MSYKPDLRQPYVIPCASWDANDRGLRTSWLLPDTYRASLTQLLAEAKSSRVILHWPFGKGEVQADGNPAGSAQWWSGEDWRQRITKEVIRKWRTEDPLYRTIAIYMASRQYHPASMDPGPEYHDLDTRDPVSINWFMTTVTPWLYEVGVSQILLDNSSNPEKMWGAVRAAARLNLPVPLVMEAVPLNWRKRVKCRPWSFMPYMCTNRYVLERDNFAAKDAVPVGREGTIWLTNHEPKATQEDVYTWRAMGWVVGSLHRENDHLIWS
jgi:hypothetical protein